MGAQPAGALPWGRPAGSSCSPDVPPTDFHRGAFSPDSRTVAVAFLSNAAETITAHVLVYDVDGGAPRQVMDTTGARLPNRPMLRRGVRSRWRVDPGAVRPPRWAVGRSQAQARSSTAAPARRLRMEGGATPCVVERLVSFEQNIKSIRGDEVGPSCRTATMRSRLKWVNVATRHGSARSRCSWRQVKTRQTRRRSMTVVLSNQARDAEEKYVVACCPGAGRQPALGWLQVTAWELAFPVAMRRGAGVDAPWDRVLSHLFGGNHGPRSPVVPAGCRPGHVPPAVLRVAGAARLGNLMWTTLRCARAVGRRVSVGTCARGWYWPRRRRICGHGARQPLRTWPALCGPPPIPKPDAQTRLCWYESGTEGEIEWSHDIPRASTRSGSRTAGSRLRIPAEPTAEFESLREDLLFIAGVRILLKFRKKKKNCILRPEIFAKKNCTGQRLAAARAGLAHRRAVRRQPQTPPPVRRVSWSCSRSCARLRCAAVRPRAVRSSLSHM